MKLAAAPPPRAAETAHPWPVEEKSGGPGGPYWRNKGILKGLIAAERSPVRRRKACLFFAETGQTA
jgi:hypothetical protein